MRETFRMLSMHCSRHYRSCWASNHEAHSPWSFGRHTKAVFTWIDVRERFTIVTLSLYQIFFTYVKDYLTGTQWASKCLILVNAMFVLVVFNFINNIVSLIFVSGFICWDMFEIDIWLILYIKTILNLMLLIWKPELGMLTKPWKLDKRIWA